MASLTAKVWFKLHFQWNSVSIFFLLKKDSFQLSNQINQHQIIVCRFSLTWSPCMHVDTRLWPLLLLNKSVPLYVMAEVVLAAAALMLLSLYSCCGCIDSVVIAMFSVAVTALLHMLLFSVFLVKFRCCDWCSCYTVCCCSM